MPKTVTFSKDSKANSTFAIDAKQVFLPERGMKVLDPAIGDFAGCTELDLSKNSLIELPDALGELAALQKLNLTGNKGLKSLPSTLAKLKKLRKLEISRTAVATPPSVPALEVLFADKNPSIDLEAVAAHTKLTNLQLSGCKLKALPTSFAGLTALKTLNLNENPLKPFPSIILELKALGR